VEKVGTFGKKRRERVRSWVGHRRRSHRSRGARFRGNLDTPKQAYGPLHVRKENKIYKSVAR